MKLNDHFDAVVMLTWSDWKTEPRSNRYHYASRFAQSLPVFFLQHCYKQNQEFLVEPSGVENIHVVSVSIGIKEQEVSDVKTLLAHHGVQKPMLWIYDSINYQKLIDAFPNAFRVYHATENYVLKTDGWNQSMQTVADSVIRLLPQIDFMVACAQGVADTYVGACGYSGPYAIIENGCDAEYFLNFKNGHTQKPHSSVAIFQGGINQRLDYDLLHSLISSMPDWEFHFCGHLQESSAWKHLLEHPNVKYFGSLPPDQFARYMCEATVGIIPFIQDDWIRNSFPLKAYEYVACGLPVVTVPINALASRSDLFETATTAEGFAQAIRAAASSRLDHEMQVAREIAASDNSYNKRFASMCDKLLDAKSALVKSRKRLTVGILYDSTGSMHVNTIREHLNAFTKYSRHEVIFIPATAAFWRCQTGDYGSQIDLSPFDVVVVHYSIRLSIPDHLDERLAEALSAFNGLKVLFIQDEYEGTEIARRWMDRLNFDLVYSCVPQEFTDMVYPPYRFPATQFIPTLTGYVPEDPSIEKFSIPQEERTVVIGYRGRRLHPVYGQLGFEKYRIGVEMKVVAEARGLPVDIEVDDARRIYGPAWYQFLGSARATLGTESGSNVFDADGSLRKRIDELRNGNPNLSFAELSARVLDTHEGAVRMNQISPKVFEAIRLRTALVLFEGTYSDVVKANAHYIPLKKDFSNVDEVLQKLSDDSYVRTITERAYQDIIASGKYSYRSFIEEFDINIERRVTGRNGYGKVLSLLVYVKPDGKLVESLPALPIGLFEGSHPLGGALSLKEVAGRVRAGAQATDDKVLSERQSVEQVGSSIQFPTSWPEQFVVDTDGSLGLGTAPKYSLDVYRPGSSTVSIAAHNDNSEAVLYSDDSVSYVGTTSNTPFGLMSGNSERARIDTAGNFLVGVDSSTWNGSLIQSVGTIILAAGTSIELSSKVCGGAVVSIYANASGNGGLFYLNYSSVAVKISGDGEAREHGSDFAVYKSPYNHTSFLKNMSNNSQTFSVVVVAGQLG